MKLIFALLSFIFCLQVFGQNNHFLITYKTLEVKGKNADTKAQRRTLEKTKLTIAFDSARVKQTLSIGDLITRSFLLDKTDNKGFLMVSGSIGNYGTPIDSTIFHAHVNNNAKNPIKEITYFEEDSLIIVLNEEDSLKREEFLCHRAVIKDADGFESTYWYTKQYQNPWTDNKFIRDELKWLPLKIILETKEMTAIMQVEELNLEIPRKKEIFDLENMPLGYMEVTLDNLKKLTNDVD